MIIIKKALSALLLLALMLAGLSACSSSGDKLTLMIYMIGSDLESKSGMATEDLQEIADSGVDLGDVNVVVCTGGAEKWRNEEVTADSNTVMHLERGGFTADEQWEAASMGDSATLAKFLSYCTENYHTDQYALILWDHGNGPVMGYGMDMLHDRDSLTLPEMKEAMEASGFSGDNKLAWVGFDACLMASAELACTWSDHADYLIASQEVEPAFGWQYSFLKDADNAETPELLSGIAKTYLEACEEYYEEKGYEDRDTTLSCMDLSKAADVEKAVNDLFGRAAGDIGEAYNRLASRRINTRALGRATTGSEYDIVDLNDAADQLSSFYPDEAEALQKALKEMVISNETNSENLSGVSIYYPFFNKYYYENSWAEAYRELDLFPEYCKYLDSYDETWLGEDLMSAASDAVPLLAEEGKYTLQLTPEQAETFAEARLHVMIHETGDAYYPVFTSADVSFDERKQTLTANYDGKALYAVNDLNEYTLPISSLISNDNGIPHYAINCTVYKFSPDDIWDMTPEEKAQNKEEYNSLTRAWFNLAVNPEDDSVKTSSMLARDDDEVGLDNLQTGKAEELGKGDWDYYLFDLNSACILTRNKDGVILPLDSWNTNEAFSYKEFTLDNGLNFEYAPLEDGDYAIMFEITDTKGNKYCSEPAQIDSSKLSFREEEEPEINEISWTEGDKVTLLDRDGLILRLANIEDDGEMIQTFELTNNTDEEVKLEGGYDNAIVNGKIDAGPLYFGLRAEPGETSTTDCTIYDEERLQSKLSFGTAESEGFIKKVNTLEFAVSVSSLDTHKKIWNEIPFLVKYSDETTPPLTSFNPEGTMKALRAECVKDYYGASADEQIIYKDEAIEVKLLFLGANEYDSMEGLLRIVNTSDDAQYFSIDGFAVNGIFDDVLYQEKIMPHTVCYSIFPLSFFPFEELGVTGIRDLSMAVRRNTDRHLLGIGYGEYEWCRFKLKTKASETGEFRPGDKTLYEKDGLRVALLEYLPPDQDEGRAAPEWVLSVENDTDKDISLGITELSENGESRSNHQDKWTSHLSFSSVGAHQKRRTLVYGGEDIKTLSFRLMTMSFRGDRILDTSDEVITLKTE